jgi:transposase-like protein
LPEDKFGGGIMQKAMKAEDIVLLLRKVEILMNQGKTVLLSCKECGISDHTYYKWRREYSGLDVSQAKELKKLKEENGRLKRVVADLTLDKLILNEALSGIEDQFAENTEPSEQNRSCHRSYSTTWSIGKKSL